MKFSFKNSKMRKLCENHKLLQRKYNKIPATEMLKRINEFDAAQNLYDISCLPQAGLHPLKGNLKNHFAVNVQFPYRLVFQPLNGDIADIKTITEILIVSLYCDYHRGYYG